MLQNNVLITVLLLISTIQAASDSLLVNFNIHRSPKQQQLRQITDKSLIKRGSSSPVQISLPFEQTYYLANLTIGSPGQSIGVLLDTGSADLWVQGYDNPYCSSSASSSSSNKRDSPHQKRHIINNQDKATSNAYGFVTEIQTSTISASESCQTFNPDNSDTYHSNNTQFGISYADSTYAYGVWGYDKVSIGKLTVGDLSFAVANMSNSSQGILGIGYPKLESSTQTYLNLPAKLAADGTIPKSLYSLFLNEYGDAGSILFGGVDHSKYTGELVTLPILTTSGNSPTDMLITLSETLVDGKSVSSDKYAALLDSGTTYSSFPQELYDAINTAIGAQYDSDLETYITKCQNSDFNITWNFDGAEIVVAGSTFIQELVDDTGKVITDKDGDDICASTISVAEGNPTFGDNFLRSAYVVFDLELNQISLAQAKYSGASSSSNDIVEVSSIIPSAAIAADYTDTSISPTTESDTIAVQTETYDLTELTGISYGSLISASTTLNTQYESMQISSDDTSSLTGTKNSKSGACSVSVNNIGGDFVGYKLWRMCVGFGIVLTVVIAVL